MTLTVQSTSNTYTLEIADLEAQILNDQADMVYYLGVLDHQEDNSIFPIRAEIKEKRSQLATVEKNSEDEVRLLREINELEDAVKEAQEYYEKESAHYELNKQNEIDSNKTRLEAEKADKEALDSYLQEEIKKDSQYFQN